MLLVLFVLINVVICNGLLSSNLCRSRISRHSIVLSSLSSSSSSSSTSTTSSVLSSAAFIAGTTIGGGFLSLPLTTFPLGFIPSVIGLILSWSYLLGSALSLSKASINMMKNDSSLNSKGSVSVFTIATDTYGKIAGVIAAGLFIILMLSTLVAQLSKVGILLPSLFNTIFTKETAISSFAIFMSLLTFGKGIQFAERINSVLTCLMIISFASIVTAAPSAGFDFSRLFSRSNFRSLLPFNYESSISWAIPVFLQLLVYTETIPLVVSRLNGDEKKVTNAIVLGSMIPLLMCIVWTMVAIGLVPVTKTLSIDPVDILLKNSSSTRIKNSILLLTLSAIMTTVIGSCLTISQFLDDLFKDKKILSKLLSIIPATMIATLGSKSLYYAATHFAGAFPVTILWGLFPPLAYLKTISKGSEEEDKRNIGQYALIFLSLLMLFINIC